MSIWRRINCIDCKKYLMIGQDLVIYSGIPEVMEKLRKFLFKHESHHLTFEPDWYNTEEDGFEKDEIAETKEASEEIVVKNS